MRWNRAWLALGLAAGTASAASGSGEESELGYQKATGTHVYAKVAGDRLVLRSLGPSTSRVAYGIDLDGNGQITETDLYYTLQPDGRICTGPWWPARKVLECTRTSRVTGSQEAIGPQTLRRLEIPLDEAAPTARNLRLLLMMNKPEGGNATAWIGYDLVTGDVKSLGEAAAPAASGAGTPASSNGSPAAAKPTPAAPAQAARAPSCPPTTQALAQWLSGRKRLESKKETPFVQSGGFMLFAQDGEDKYDTAGVSMLGATPLRMTAIIHDGKPNALWAHFAGHDIKPFEPAFRAEFGGRKGAVRCDAMECRWQLVQYPAKAPKGVLSDVSISLYNLTKTESTLSCKYGE